MRVKTIKRESGEPYLIRYYIFECRWFQIVLHHIMLSDYDCLHDHPWAFISIILTGGYWERTPKNVQLFKIVSELALIKSSTKELSMSVVKKWKRPGSFLFRRAKWIHALELPEGKDAWSLVIMFKRKRQWGFWTKRGWVEWFNYKPTQTCE